MITRRLVGLTVALLTLGAVCAPGASADFGFAKWDGVITADQAGAPYTQAGGHPYQIDTTILFNSHENSSGATVPDGGGTKDVIAQLPPGFVGNPTVLPQCTNTQLLHIPTTCPIASQLGIAYTAFGSNAPTFAMPLYNMVPPRGVPARFGFKVLTVPIVLDGAVRGDGAGLHLGVDSRNISQALPVSGARLVFWGVPADPAHDGDRCSGGDTGNFIAGGLTGTSPNLCDGFYGPEDLPHSAGTPPVPFLTMPTSCTAPGEGLPFSAAIDSWLQPGTQNPDGSPLLTDPAWKTATFFTHEQSPNESVQSGVEYCDGVPSNPQMTLQPTAHSAESASGLNVDLTVPTEGLLSPTGTAQSTLKKVSVTLPQGMTINPSQGEGLGVCTPAEFEAETATSEPGAACPSTSKIGTVQITTPLLEEPILYVAQQHNNPFGSLLALYVVAKSPTYGVIVKAAGQVEPDEETGQLTTTFDNLPQAPFSDFKLSFREGQRSPLITPPACGHYTATARFTPWSDPATTIVREPGFDVTSGVGGGPCPSAGAPPFHPGLLAGTTNNAAGHYSPFYVRLSRNDGEQELTHFSIKLPPGVTGKLAGIPLCSDAQIAVAKSRGHEGGGGEEEANPSCPAASEVGHTLVGAGVGSALAYAPGKVYLAGPYHGAPISIAAITAAKVGPFDLGTVVVREALRVNPETGEVFVDATGSDPIPHIIDGITVHARDIRVYVDRPEFTLNPTSCEPTSTASTVLGSGLDFASAADDQPVTVTSPFQAADCASLPFKPKLKLSLEGGTKRGATPAFRAELTQRPGEASIGRAQVTLPHSEFLEQAHIKTICTRTVFAEGTVPGERCPAGSIYGHARAITPILSEPLEGPVYLRSSEHRLPDLVAALHNGEIDIDLDGHIDSVKGGRIRNTFETVPDAPVSKFTLTMQGGSKGLLVNSTNLCQGTHRAIADFTGHNGKVDDFNPAVGAQCSKARKHHRRHGRRARPHHRRAAR
jgi:hypothetical protein